MKHLHGGFGETFRGLLAEGALHYARCRTCGEALRYSARVCGQGHAQLEWVRAGGGATLVAVTVYHQSYDDAFPAPHAVAQVELDEGPRLTVALRPDAAQLPPGTRLVARVSDGHLRFDPA